MKEVFRSAPLRIEELYNRWLLNNGLNEAVEECLWIKQEKVYTQNVPVRETVRPKRLDFGFRATAHFRLEKILGTATT
jgi:hypothetical protein